MKFIQMLRPELHLRCFRFMKEMENGLTCQKSRLKEQVLHLEKQRKDKKDIL